MTKNKKDMPDFDRLNDRIVAQAPVGPFFELKTNLDPDKTEEENPYHHKQEKSREEKHQFNRFFNEGEE